MNRPTYSLNLRKTVLQAQLTLTVNVTQIVFRIKTLRMNQKTSKDIFWVDLSPFTIILITLLDD